MKDSLKEWAAKYRAEKQRKQDELKAEKKRIAGEDRDRHQKAAEERKVRQSQQDGRGDPISGSRLFRDFCVTCGEPIRVCVVGTHMCLQCKPTGVPGNVDNSLVKNGMEYEGGRFHSAEW